MSGPFTSISDSFQNMGSTRRVLLLVLAGALIAGLWGVGRWASEPMYVALYRDLDFKDIAAIQESLDAAAIPNKLGGGGSEIQVPVADAARARVALAKDGKAIGGRPGLELFDKPAWGMTDFSQRVTYQRALEGELARTIAGIDGIGHAQVHLAIPSGSTLRRREQQAGASVVLSLEPGASLARETIQGITFVVSNSVDRLTADNVAVMDAAGELLSVPSGTTTAPGVTSHQMEMQRTVERALVTKIQDLLEPVIGAGHVRAEVAADLSFEKVDRTLETVGPAALNGAPSESSPPAGSADSTNTREFQRREGSVGRLIRLTAAVLVDSGAAGKVGYASGDSASGRTLEAIVRNAIGINDERGDRVSIVFMPFDSLAAPTPAAAGTGSETSGPDILGLAERVIRPLVGLVAVLFLALLGLKTLKLPTGLPAPAAPPVSAAAEGAGTGSLDTARREPDPEEGLEVIRGWLSEGRR